MKTVTTSIDYSLLFLFNQGYLSGLHTKSYLIHIFLWQKCTSGHTAYLITTFQVSKTLIKTFWTMTPFAFRYSVTRINHLMVIRREMC